METLSKEHTKELAKLKQKKYRENTKAVIVEGVRLIDQLQKNGILLQELYISDPDKYTLKDFNTNRIFHAEPWQIEKIADTKHPQDIAALVHTKTVPIAERSFLLYLDDIKEPGNLGAIFRTATSAGISGVILSPDCCEVFNPKVIRASLGTVFSLPIEIHDIDWLKQNDAAIIATTLHDSIDLFKAVKPDGNIVLVIGSEAFGIRWEIIDLTNLKVKIPISNSVESLNAAVAAGIAIFHFTNR